MLAEGRVGFSPNPYIIGRVGSGMPHRLDNSRLVSKTDPGNMLGAVDSFADCISNLGRYRMSKVPGTVGRVGNVLLMGMGGSGSAGDVLLDWLGDRLTVPGVVAREPSLPRFAARGTVFVGLSYSGETRETLRAFREARDRDCLMAGVGSGGRLRTLCRESSIPFFQVGAGLTPRAALGQMVVAGTLALEALGIVANVRGELRAAGEELRRLRSRFRVGVPLSRNRAKQFAVMLRGRFPVVYSLERMSSVARRFKNQLAENSKVAAKYGLLPEAGHNEVEAYGPRSTLLLPVLIRDWEETVGESELVDAFKTTIQKSTGTRPLEVRVRGGTKLARLLAPIMFLDYVSVYLAILRGVDPTPTPWIREYKRRSMGVG